MGFTEYTFIYTYRVGHVSIMLDLPGVSIGLDLLGRW